jgi:hypothetical protein
MNTSAQKGSMHVLAAIAVAIGLAAGTYGIASAANGSGSGSGDSSGQAATTAPSAQHPWGTQRSDETLLTGDAKAKVEEAALAKLPGASIERVETDADGHAAYEAHVIT